MTLNDVAKQIQKHCECFKDRSENELIIMTKELIRLLSLSTCWSTEACETLLKGTRVERVDMPDITCNCCGNYFKFKPYFNANISDVKVTSVVREGLKTTEIELEQGEDFEFTMIEGYPEIIVDVSKYAKMRGCISCDKRYLKFEYQAGYDELPDCLFPEVCELLTILTANRLGCGSLDECCAMTQADVGYKLKSKKIGELSWTWTKDIDSLEYAYNQLVVSNRFKALSLISLCGLKQDKLEMNLWVYGSDCGVEK